MSIRLRASQQADEEIRAAHKDERLAALSYLSEAWEEALLDGVPPECVAHVALFRAMTEMVISFGEEATAEFADKLGDRIRRGEFTIQLGQQS